MKIVIGLVLSFVLAPSMNAQSKSDRERDGLVGPVKSVQTEAVVQVCESGKFTELAPSASREDYDLNGRVIGNRNRFIIDSPTSRMLVYPFDEGMPRIEKPTYWEDGRLIYTDVYTFDNTARRAAHVMYNAGGVAQSRSIITFDERGRMFESKTYNADGSLGSWNVLKRDTHGNVVESSFYKADGTLVEVQTEGCSHLNKFASTYEFDAAGNWIKQITTISVLQEGRTELVPLAIRRRTIVYY